MDELDDLLRDTFRDREDAAMDATGLAAAARTGHARHAARRRQLLAVGAVGVLAAGGSSALALSRHGSDKQPGVALVLNRNTAAPASGTTPGPIGRTGPTSPAGSHPSGSPASGPGLPATDPPQPPGTRAWSSHGLQVSVPEAWKPNQTRCGSPIAPTVLIGDGATELCLLSNPPAVDVVAFGTAKVTDPSPQPALHSATIDGHAARIGSEALHDGRTATVIIVPDLDVSVTVKSKSQATMSAIVGSARIVAADANGCPSQAATVEPTGKPARPGARSTMVPDQPVKAIVCHYGAPYQFGGAAFNGPTFLTNGSTIAPDNVAELVGILNTLKPGQATWTGLAGACPAAAHDGYMFRFFYASGLPVDVYLHTSDCDHIGFDNGAVAGYLSQQFVKDSQKFLPDMAFTVSEDVVR